MVNSRSKGARGEYQVRDMLREYTDLQFERVPSSGALHYLKGDLYVPNEKNYFCIEVKNYNDSPLNDTMFTALKTNNLIKWWNKIVNQADNCNQEPLLFFKYNRSKVFVVTEREPKNVENYFFVSWLNCYITLAEDWLELEDITFIG